ncbi:MAG: hypothetical protein ACOC6F_04070, partial [bacterium]
WRRWPSDSIYTPIDGTSDPVGLRINILSMAFIFEFYIDWVAIFSICILIFASIIDELGFQSLGFALLFAACPVCLVLDAVLHRIDILSELKGVAPPGVELGEIYRGVIQSVILQ